LDIDRGIAVGERGLILRTEDGGRSWTELGPRSTDSYYAIGFDESEALGESSRSGLVVGGRIDSVTGRSHGIVELTKDDGKTWTRSAAIGLPRLLGLQQIKHRHWIAWGDWSDHWQSSLFESIDGGRSWNARPTPSGHIRSAAVDKSGRTLIIDRNSRVYYSQNGLEYIPISVEFDPFRPLRFCRVSERGWWVGGDCGQLYFSADGLQWTRVLIPGNARDHALIHLKDAVVRGDKIWLVGEPGRVVWRSEDNGGNWTMSSMPFSSALTSIHALDEQVLLTCGALGRIHLSRNSGSAWIDCHVSGSRVACHAIASTEETMAWDALAYVVHESQRRASATLVHHQDLQGANGHRPERQERLIEAARQMGLDRLAVLSEFPVGDLRTGIRTTDLGYYQVADPSQSELVRQLVLEIRCNQPDLIIAEDTASKQSLVSATAAATQQAIQLAASPSFQCFSPESGLVLPAWNVQRVLLRTAGTGGLNFVPTTMLPNNGMLLSELMAPTRFLQSSNPVDPIRNVGKSSYRLPTQRTASIKHPLDGMILDPDTRRIEKQRVKRKMASLVAASNSASKASHLLATRGAGVWAEAAWDDAMMEFAKELPKDILLHSLWVMALDSRRAGNWHRWNSALNLIVERDGDGSMAELATRELMTYYGSPEVHRVLQDQWASIDSSKNSSSPSSGVATAAHASPFAVDQGVAFASIDIGSRLTPMARMRGTEIFARLLARWPEPWQAYRTEPEWAWLITSRYRSRAMLQGTPVAELKDQILWPTAHPSTTGWSALLVQEQLERSDPENDQPLRFRIPWVESRPYLDGNDDEDCWEHATEVQLGSLWSIDPNATPLRLMRDKDFLFLHCRCRKQAIVVDTESKSRPSSTRTAQRQRDRLDDRKDHVRIRLDLDRDYSTWFEFAWDSDGETLDQCNDMLWWNPEWYVAVNHDREFWSAEIAIPFASLFPDPHSDYPPTRQRASGPVVTAAVSEDRDIEAIDWGKQTWGLSLVREIPSAPMQSIPMSEGDRWARNQWILVSPRLPQPSPSAQAVDVADPTLSFPPTRR
jgi:photosystem II stability/assembly factor-like uncharacterized protein